MTLSLTASIVLSGCVSIPPERKYMEPAAEEPAAVVTSQGVVGGATTTCQVPGSSRICRAWIFAVGENLTPWNGNSVRVAAGVHRFILVCNSWSGGPMFFGRMSSVSQTFRGPFEVSRRYFVRCELQQGVAQVWLADSADGPPLPQFVVEPADR